MTIDKRLCLIARNGDLLYPYTKQARDGRRGFALAAPGERDSKGGGHYTSEIEEVIRRVVLDGWKVRARTATSDHRKAREGSYGIGHRAIQDVHVDQAFFHLLNQASGNRSLALSGVPAQVKPDDLVAQEAVDRVATLRSEDYVAAFQLIESRLTTSQRVMLDSHANAASATRSMEQLAIAAGYTSYEAANVQFGKMAGLFAQALGISGLPQKTMVLAEAVEPGPNEHWRWKLRQPFVDALRQLGIADSDEDWLREAAQAKLNVDTSATGTDGTTRQALVDARIGQGAYRQGLMKIWSGRCAVTGVDIPEVLIASHIKSWKRSTDEERLDPRNGLLLAASVDKLFDKGLISFDRNGQLMMSTTIQSQDLTRLGLTPESHIAQLHPNTQSYLADHRRFHGFSRD